MVEEFFSDGRFSPGGTFSLAPQSVQWNSGHMNNEGVTDWRADLDAARDLSDPGKQNHGFLLTWFKSWRVMGMVYRMALNK